MEGEQEALVALARALERVGYSFVTPTPETHRRVLARKAQAENLRDVFGWSCMFSRELIGEEMFGLLTSAGACEACGDGRFRSRVRYSRLQGELYAHSAYPTLAADAVFFGPDTYRFCAFVARETPRARFVVDVGCGSGAGGIVAARASGAQKLVLADVNPRALWLSEVNAMLAGRGAAFVESDVLSHVSGAPDLVVANPPFMRDPSTRAYRDGGGSYGEALSVRIAREALARLAPGGTLLLYAGAPVVDGRDVFKEALGDVLEACDVTYDEIDPDVFGEALDDEGYERVERIAAVGLRALKTS